MVSRLLALLLSKATVGYTMPMHFDNSDCPA